MKRARDKKQTVLKWAAYILRKRAEAAKAKAVSQEVAK